MTIVRTGKRFRLVRTLDKENEMGKFTKFVVLMVVLGSILAFTGCNGSYYPASSGLYYPAFQSYYRSLDRIDASTHHSIDHLYSTPLYGHCDYSYYPTSGSSGYWGY